MDFVENIMREASTKIYMVIDRVDIILVVQRNGNWVKIDSKIRNRTYRDAGTIQSSRNTAVDSWWVEQDIGLPDADISYSLHLHSRNYVSALLAVFPKYRALKFTRVYISHYLEIFTRAMSNLHIRHTYLYMGIHNTRILKLNIINSVRDI